MASEEVHEERIAADGDLDVVRAAMERALAVQHSLSGVVIEWQYNRDCRCGRRGIGVETRPGCGRVDIRAARAPAKLRVPDLPSKPNGGSIQARHPDAWRERTELRAANCEADTFQALSAG